MLVSKASAAVAESIWWQRELRKTKSTDGSGTGDGPAFLFRMMPGADTTTHFSSRMSRKKKTCHEHDSKNNEDGRSGTNERTRATHTYAKSSFGGVSARSPISSR